MKVLEGYEDFAGVRKDAHRTRLPEGSFQEDVNGDRFQAGTWRRRRGMRRVDVSSQGSPVETLIGFELPGSDYGLVIVAGSVAIGETNRAQLVQHTEGYGVSASGSGGSGS